MRIVGAGLAGLLAGHFFRGATIFESRPRKDVKHRAVLRFRSPAISEATGIPFREVTVRKGIFFDGEFIEPNVRVANMYSQKVIGVLQDRSIWNIKPEKRWIPPKDFQKQLAEGLDIKYDTYFDFTDRGSQPIISTVPMDLMARTFAYKIPDIFHRMKVHVVQGSILYDSEVEQTIYFPDPTKAYYRATLSGSRLTVESISDLKTYEFGEVCKAFCVEGTMKERGIHPNGKIAPIAERNRRSFIRWLTQKKKIYSLGRYATWRNILLDDVLKDIVVINRLLKMDGYEEALHAS